MRKLAPLALLIALVAACSDDTGDDAVADGSTQGGSGAAPQAGSTGGAGRGGNAAGQPGAPSGGQGGKAGSPSQGGEAGASPEGGAAGQQANGGAAAGGDTAQGGAAGESQQGGAGGESHQGGAAGEGSQAGAGGDSAQAGAGGQSAQAGAGGESAQAGAGGDGAQGGSAGAPSLCGDGVKGGDEGCDQADLGGATCASLGHVGLPKGPDGSAIEMGGVGALSCTAACAVDEAACDAPVRLIGFAATQPPPGGGEATLSVSFAWDASASVYRTAGQTRSLLLPAGVTLPVGPTLLAFASDGAPLVLADGAVPPDFPFLRIDEPAWPAPLYDPCWDYVCEEPLPPRAKRATRRAPLMLRHVGPGDEHVIGAGQAWVPARGKQRLVIAVLYADSPMPEASMTQLLSPEGEADSTSLAAVPPWFAARSAEIGLGDPVDVEIVYTGVQIKLPAEQVPGSYDACANADFKALVTPQVTLADSDILVQFYWAPEGSQCANHVLRQSRSYMLFATPSFFAPQGLVVSAAHELMHLLGASDKYSESIAPGSDGKPHGCWFEGTADYDAHDIMCHRVGFPGPDGAITGFENPPLHQLVVSPLTAREIGWEDLDGDGTLEVLDACPWDGGC